jgi:hypothetical protein
MIHQEDEALELLENAPNSGCTGRGAAEASSLIHRRCAAPVNLTFGGLPPNVQL